MRFSHITYLLFLYITVETTTAQEYVSGLVKNRIIEDANYANRFSLKSFKSIDTLSLPFFDDFTSVTIFPDSRLWTDKYVYINSQFAVNPPTYGVATFDALDQNGAIYSNAKYSYFPADTLTSHYINLDFPVDSNIYLSFYYQAKGLGHMPNTSDSLMLQFFKPLQNSWTTVWKIPGDFLKPFKQVLIPVNDTSYLHSSFRFRFMNYASLNSSADEPGRVGDNSDWNIDYVYLNKGRNDHDTVLRDLAVTAPLPSLLSYYESIPWNHFSWAVDELMASGKTSVYYHYYSPDPNENIGFNRSLQIKSLYSNYTDNYDSIGFNIHAGTTLLYEPYYQKLNYDSNDSAAFRVTFFVSDYNLKPMPALLYNDTVRRTQVFKDYYAYDDGSAENGYGLIGIGTANSRVAYKFFSYLPDSLRAVDIYFNDVFHNANANLFNLTVWKPKPEAGCPGDTLLSRADTSFYPVFQNRNHFIRYVLPKPIAIADTFYVGWIQNSDGFLNVGLDVNNISTPKMFYNINGTWQQSTVQGSLMIRPVFGKRIVTGFHEKNVSASIKLYPNPASEVLYVELANNSNSKLSLFFYDLSGKLLLSSVSYGEPVNISSLPNGFYIVRIDTNQSTSTFHKLRVIR